MAQEKLSYVFPAGTKDFIPVEKSAAAHNGIYRGKDLTSYFDSGDMSTAIANGTFENIFIGDYITKSITLPAITYTDKAGDEQTLEAETLSIGWYVAGLDYFYNVGDPYTQTHHILLVSYGIPQRYVAMNPKVDGNDTTAGGYIGSDMWRIHMPRYSTAVKNTFGSNHVLTHKEYLTNSVDNTANSMAGGGILGYANGGVYVDVDVNIPNENMLLGSNIYSSSPFDAGESTLLWPIIRLAGHKIDGGVWEWTRSVASSTNFCVLNGHKLPGTIAASFKGMGGIRPYFLLY